MKVTVIGKKHLNFKNNQTNEVIDVHSVFVTHKNPFSDDITKYEGEGCSVINLPVEVYEQLNIGQQYLMDFDKKGKLLEVNEI